MEIRGPASDVLAESVTLRHGKMITIYRAPYSHEGPVRYMDQNRRQVMVYMFAHFVFYWTEGEGTVRIAHGTIRGDNNIPLHWTFNIDQAWDQGNFVQQCKCWTRGHMSKFKRRRPQE